MVRKANKVTKSPPDSDSTKKPMIQDKNVVPEGTNDTVRKVKKDFDLADARLSDLCRDMKRGRESDKLAPLRQQAKKDRLAKLETKSKQYNEDATEIPPASDDVSENISAPQLKIVNGKIQVDQSSMLVDRHKRERPKPGEKVVYQIEDDYSRRVNSLSWTKRSSTDRWNEEDTERFYNALSQYGTDFTLICALFPGRSRRQLKNKFASEERRNSAKITKALRTRKPIDLSARLSSTVL